MATTACAERFSRPCWAGRPGRLWRFALGVSLLLHGALLWLPVRGLRDRSASVAPLAALTLTLKRPTPRGAASSFAAPVAVAAVAAVTPRGVPARVSSSLRPSAAPAVATPESDAPQATPERHLDIDQLREQARDLARAPAERLVRGGDRRPGSPAAVPDLLDRPLLAALSRRIGKPLQVASEQRLADGSRMIRFVGNVCLHVPQQLHLGQENAFGPTVLVPTNCSD